MGKKRKQPASLPMFGEAPGTVAGRAEASISPATVPVLPDAPPPRAAVPTSLRVTGPTCLQVDFCGPEEGDRVEARFSVVTEAAGDEVAELSRREFLSFAAQIGE